MKLRKLLILFFVFLLLTACGQAKPAEGNSSSENLPEFSVEDSGSSHELPILPLT